MDFFRNNALISLNTAPMPQNIFFMIIEIKACTDNADAGGGGVQNLEKLADVILEHSLN